MERWERDVFFENGQISQREVDFIDKCIADAQTNEERYFLERIKAKEMGEFAPSSDLLVSEQDNADELYFVRHYFTEYSVGRSGMSPIYCVSFEDIMKEKLFPLLGRNVTILDWLREQKFACVGYYGNNALR
ncbi:MAG: hypothetical protein ACI35Q_07185 [Marinilabiliaceae bacterium]